jgi:hypothetical protein
MSEILIQFSTSTAFSSSLIRRLTHSPWSHTDIVLPGEGLLGVSGKDDSILDPGGVRIRPFNSWPYLIPPRVATLRCTELIAQHTLEFAKSQIGKPFDNGALWGFLDDEAQSFIQGRRTTEPKWRDWRSVDAWYCSEYVTASLENGGFFPYSIVVFKTRVSPSDLLLLLNPFLSKENIDEFLQLGAK